MVRAMAKKQRSKRACIQEVMRLKRMERRMERMKKRMRKAWGNKEEEEGSSQHPIMEDLQEMLAGVINKVMQDKDSPIALTAFVVLSCIVGWCYAGVKILIAPWCVVLWGRSALALSSSALLRNSSSACICSLASSSCSWMAASNSFLASTTILSTSSFSSST